ncbi:uncharacterized protein LOC108198046 [Daucus carota subsp. sativus]|uniref:uncharacterized protein LOC108198046 n=1 Tax=Daucus carota subsp. sativus TaxID=79200 RepID=UPI0007EEFD87|nr:PREDICTED: uncharacterized protein LOC108198046 [Daucus carota subsp. sativus]
MEVYVDDMLVKSKEAQDHIQHLAEMFDILRRYRMKLNPQKCVFGVESDECEEAFQKIKEQLGKPPLLAKPVEGETLILYLAISRYSVSAVLVKVEKDAQFPVYNVSKRLQDAETRYTSMEKLVYSLILAARKLRPYFQAHKIEVRTSYPLRQIMRKPEATGRLMKWAVELGQFDLDYKPRVTIKGQALADFLLEFEDDTQEWAIVPYSAVVEPIDGLLVEDDAWWNLHVDGAVNSDGAGVGIVLVSPGGCRLLSAIHLGFPATNNDVEYEALINGLSLAIEMKARNLIVYSDSMSVVHQVNGGFLARGWRTNLYMTHTQELMKKFKEVHLKKVPREKNEGADALAKASSRRDTKLLGTIQFCVQEKTSVSEVQKTTRFREDLMEVENDIVDTWMTPILKFIQDGQLPESVKEARSLRYRAARFVIYDGVLYKRGFNQPLLKCIAGEDYNYILREVHEGICGNHSGGSSLALKILRQGYYWPTMRSEASKFVQACDKCQRFATYSSRPAASLTSLLSPWPFALWGIDLIGELPKAKGGVRYAVVAVDYFTKWAEAAPLATITAKKITSFVFNSIVCRFGIPFKLISDNGKQFDSRELKKLCDDLNIRRNFAAVYHPQSNGQTEAINKIIKHMLKAKLEEKKGDWPEELPMVLWSYNTTPRTTTGESRFMLTYGCEAMVPVEVRAGSFRRDHFQEEANEVNQRLHLDMLEEVRRESQVRLAAYQQRTARFYNSRVKPRPFKIGDLVLRKMMPGMKVPGHGVFGANWEGPYRIRAEIFGGAYYLEDMQGEPISKAWNAEHLKKYYQ